MEQNFYATYFDVEKTHWLMRGRRAIIRTTLASAGVAPGASILDFGCGSGITVASLSEAGYRAQGVDFAPDAITFGTGQGISGLQVVADEKLPYADASFDAITCMDVLEHLQDEQPALTEMRRVLKPGGVLVVMVPAYMWLWGRQDEVAHHYRRYTLGRLVEVVRRGELLAIERRSYFNTLLFPLIALVRSGSWMLGLKSRRESDFDLNNGLLNAVFGAVFSLERVLLSKFNLPFGVSILLVARKEEV